MTIKILVDKAFWNCTAIDTETWLAAVTDSEIDVPDDIECDWTQNKLTEIAEFIEQREDGAEYSYTDGDNVYNHENDFSDMFTYTVFYQSDNSDWCYSNDVYIAIEVHRGGDVRGNYGGVRLFKVDCPAESGFCDWMLSWDVRYSNGDDARPDGEFSAGYHSNPGYFLSQQLKNGEPMWSEKRKEWVGWIDGRAVAIAAQYFAADDHGEMDLGDDVPYREVVATPEREYDDPNPMYTGISVKDFMRSKS